MEQSTSATDGGDVDPSRMGLRILTLATALDSLGGLERAQLQACEQLRAHGHEVALMYTGEGALSTSWASVASRRVRVGGYGLHRRRPLTTSRTLASTLVAIRSLRPDVIYAHHHRHALAAALARRPSVCHLHLPPPRSRSRQEAFALRRMTRLVAVSAFTARQWTQHLQLDRRRVDVVPNAVDADRFAPAEPERRRELRRALGLPADRFLVAYAARIAPDKGIDLALEASARLPAERFHLAVAGAPNPADFAGDEAAGAAYERELRRRFAAAPVSWLGRLPGSERLLAAADAVVLPSRFPDPMPLLVLESLACGTPVVAAAVGGIPELLTGGLASLLVAPGDCEQIVDRLRRLHADPSGTRSLGLAGRRHVEAEHRPARLGDMVAEQVEAAAAGVGR